MQRHRQIALGVFVLMVLLLFPGPPASGQQASNAKAWSRWDVQLTTSRSYHLSLGNPYRDLTIQTTFTPTSCSNSPWCGTFTGYGFWDGGTTFRIRSAFPVGTWRWEVSCRGVTNGIDCATDPALNTYVNGTKTTTWGTVNVTAEPAAPELLKRGFVRMEVKSGRYLTYGDGVAKFFWQADTSWKAAITDQSNHTTWNTFLSDRKQRGFTVILMAPSSSADDPAVATGTLFEDLGTSCLGNAWPKSCSRWRPAYWRTLDEKIRLANEMGFLVVLIGLMDPQGNPSGLPPKYPRPEDAVIFARNLVARLSGNHVIFSPSFDDRLADTEALMDAVGNALRQASPRHLVTAHLAGAAPVSDYQTVANKEWHCFHFFQSGHAFNLSTACPSGPSEQYDCAVMRARTLPAALYDNAVPLTMALAACPGIPVPQPNPVYKPNVNGEAAYDWTYSAPTTQMIDTPAGVRHTGYYSTLSGAFGFSLGVKGIYDWTNVSAAALGGDGSRHMKILGDQFRQQPWQALQKSSTLIKNQPAREDQKMVMAVTNDNNFAMLYLPNNGEALINASSLLGFDCNTSTWSKSWIDPKSGNPPSQVPGCENPTSSNPWHTLRRPLCIDSRGGETGNCDWVIVLKKTGATFPSAVMEGVDKYTVPEVYPRLREDGAGWEIAARLPASASSRVSVSVSSCPSRDKLLRLPVAAGLTDGSTLIVWQGEELDGDLDGVFARVLGANGTPAGRELRINETTRHGQINPAVAATSSGGAIAAWSSFAQDGELGGIFLRVYSGQGRFATEEILVNETTSGHQDFPRVAAGTGGNFAVAWTSDRWDGLGSSIYARLFDPDGQPLGPEILVKEATLESDHYLTDLAMEQDGGFTVIRSSYGPLEAPLGIYKQRFDSDGMPVGEELLLMATD